MVWLCATIPGRLVLAAVTVLFSSFMIACAGHAGLGCIGVFLAVGLTIASALCMEAQTP